MNCPDVDRLLDAYVDGQLKPDRRAELDEHLARCRTCARDRDELHELRRATKHLPRRIAPTRELLPGVREAILRESAGPRQVGWRPWVGLAASLFVLTASVWTGLWVTRNPTPAAGAAPVARDAELASEFERSGFLAAADEYDQATARLLDALEAHREDLPPETRAVISENLRIIDQAIDEVREALAGNPSDPRNGRVLNALYRQKVEFLWRVSRLSS